MKSTTNKIGGTLQAKSMVGFVRHALSVAVIGILAQQSMAATQDEGEVYNEDTPTTTFETLVVIADGKPKEAVAEKQIRDEMIRDSHDLVRYNTEVDVAEVGRYGNKGFAMRGVDGNRVAMNIDGMALPEVEVNEIFSPYGYMYEGRFNPDLEVMRSVRVQAGADSLATGSGAIGGSVSYLTKTPNTLVRGGEGLGGYAKVGYSTKNEEKSYAVGLAGISEQLEFLVNYAYREGHETKNHAMRKADNARLDPYYVMSAEEMPYYYDSSSAIYPDPMHYDQDSVLAKLYYKPTDQHRFGVHGLYQYRTSHINTHSKLSSGGRNATTTRRAWDEEEAKMVGGSYRYTSMGDWLDYLDVNYTHNKITGVADTWVYDVKRINESIDIDRATATEATLDNREYRPTYTTSRQGTLELKSVPLDFGKGGEHTLTLKGTAVKADYTLDNIVIVYDDTGTYINPRYTHRGNVFVDADKKNHSIVLTDSIILGDKLRSSLGIRYDNYRYTPYFDDSTFPRYPESTRVENICNNNDPTMSVCKIHADSPEAKFDRITWGATADYQANDWLSAHYKIGTGFLSPTVSQMYMSFEGMGVKQIPNLNLKAETSLNQELMARADFGNVSLSLAGYVTDYKNFIHTKYWEGDNGVISNATGCRAGYFCMTSMNLDKAKVRGQRFGARVGVSDWFNLAGDLSFSVDYHKMRDKARVQTDYSGVLEVNTLASAPTSTIFGVDYRSADSDWDMHLRLRRTEAKPAGDTKVINIVPDTSGQLPYREVVETYKHADRSTPSTVVDLYGSKRFGKNQNFILNAGVYNLTNTKYIPWESLRQFNNVSVNNSIDPEGYGFDRYTATGRNYAVALTYEF